MLSAGPKRLVPNISTIAKSDRWYVILDSIETENPIDGLLPLVWSWKKDEDEAESSLKVERLFNSRQETTKIDGAAMSSSTKKELQKS